MKIGLVGEDPNDTKSIENLLVRQYPRLNFVTLLQRVNGSMLDNKKAINNIRREYEIQKPDCIVFIRDLDSHEKDKEKKQLRQSNFTKANRMVDKKGIFLLNIYELEALILADIDTFNKAYGCAVEKYPDPMKVPDPKEVLIEATRKADRQFNVSHNPQVFGLLNFETLKKNCRYFAAFIKKFDTKIAG